MVCGHFDVLTAGRIPPVLYVSTPPFLMFNHLLSFFRNDSSNGELFDQILQSRVNLTDDALPDASHSARLIIRCLLHRSPKQRMKAKELLSQKWVNVSCLNVDRVSDQI